MHLYGKTLEKVNIQITVEVSHNTKPMSIIMLQKRYVVDRHRCHIVTAKFGVFVGEDNSKFPTLYVILVSLTSLKTLQSCHVVLLILVHALLSCFYF